MRLAFFVVLFVELKSKEDLDNLFSDEGLKKHCQEIDSDRDIRYIYKSDKPIETIARYYFIGKALHKIEIIGDMKKSKQSIPDTNIKKNPEIKNEQLTFWG